MGQGSTPSNIGSQTTNSSYKGNQSSYSYTPCKYVHDGRDIVIRDTARNIVIGGAKAVDIPWDEMDLALVIDCSDGVNPPTEFVKSAPEKFMEKIGGMGRPIPDIIKLKWNDGSAPTALPKFWQALWDILPTGLVVISCLGSHGRTGTALACLMVVNGMTADESIQAVRALHCPKAVETKSQEAYIHYVYDRLWGGTDPKAVRVKVVPEYEETKVVIPVSHHGAAGTSWKPVEHAFDGDDFVD